MWWTEEIPRTRRGLRSGTQCSLGLHSPIVVAKDEKSGFALASVRKKTLAIVEVLDSGEGAARRTEIDQHPGDCAVQEGNAAEHRDLPAVDIGLIFLGEAREVVAVVIEEGIGAEFAQDEGLVVRRLPGDRVDFLGQAVVPANILIAGDDIEEFA